jgi:hypothetical protein
LPEEWRGSYVELQVDGAFSVSQYWLNVGGGM